MPSWTPTAVAVALIAILLTASQTAREHEVVGLSILVSGVLLLFAAETFAARSAPQNKRFAHFSQPALVLLTVALGLVVVRV